MTTAVEKKVPTPDLYEQYHMGDITYRELVSRLGVQVSESFLSRMLRYFLIALKVPGAGR